VREARHTLGITQAQLAQRSGTSRITIARLESASAHGARLGTVAAVCEALGLEVALVTRGSAETSQTILERERARSRHLDLRRRHAALAAHLLSLPEPEARELISRARKVVDQWERDRTCSHHYISRWRALLGGGVEAAARALLESGGWADALFLNSPWSFALGPRTP
jgi:transcriptional regulator with XRE-family HTH domain